MHSLATYLGGAGENLSVIQSLLRHSKPTTTAKYTHPVKSAQMAAQKKFRDAIKVTAAVV